MNYIDFILGVVCVFLGVVLISLYNNLDKKQQKGGFTFKLRLGGICLIIIGIGLFFRSCN